MYYKIEMPKGGDNLTSKDINMIAKLVANVNTAYWDAVGFAGKLNHILKQVDEEVLEKVAASFKRLKNNNDSELIDPEIYSRETQDASYWFGELKRFLE